MTQILALIGGTLGAATRGNGNDPSTPETLERLTEMLNTTEMTNTTVGTPAAEAPGVASEPHIPNDVLTSLVAPPPVDASTPDIDEDEPSASNDVPPDEDANAVGDTSESEPASPMGHVAAVAALQDSVREAQEKAETQLAELVDRVRQEAKAQHEDELARVTHAAEQRQEQAVAEACQAVEAEAARAREEIERHHAEELRTVHDTVQVEVTAAVEAAVRDKDLRHAEELARVQPELEAQHVDSLQRVGDSVLQSLETLTERMAQAA